MEPPASLVRRDLSGIEMRLACIVYGCANIEDDVPKCTLPKVRVVAVLGCSENAFASASTKIARLGYWSRVNDPPGSSLWRWEILIKPGRGFQYGTVPTESVMGSPVLMGPGPQDPGDPLPSPLGMGSPAHGGPRTGKKQEVEQTTEQQQQAAAFRSLLHRRQPGPTRGNAGLRHR